MPAAAALLLALLLAAPIAAVLLAALAPAGDTWRHMAATVLPRYLANTALLALGVGLLVTVAGVSLAWLVTAYRFPGRALFEWALLLPLAMPAYVIAYAYADWLEVAGPVQSWLREVTGWKVREYRFPDVRSLGGAVLVFACVLYPYVYLLARAAFAAQSASLVEAGRLLGRSGRRIFLSVALPMARPAIAAGVAFALMETLADYGAVSYLAVDTFTTGIYRAWFSMSDAAAAAQLACALLVFVALLIALERLLRARRRFHQAGGRALEGVHLHGMRAAAAVAACLAPLTLGFLLPAAILVRLIITDPELRVGARFWQLVGNSLTLAALAAAVAVVLALLLVYGMRLARGFWVGAAVRLAALGYALPGVVIAVGIMVPLGRLDNMLAAFFEAQFGWRTGLLFTGGLAALVYACVVRFLAIALQTTEAGFARITPSMDDAARSLGLGPFATLVRVHLPLVGPSAAAAALLVFVDVMKELPATLALRPFNFDTLAVEAYNLARDERLSEAAVPSLVIVAAGLLPVALLARQVRGTRVR